MLIKPTLVLIQLFDGSNYLNGYMTIAGGYNNKK